MVKFLLWMLLFVICWPAALLALVLYPIAWVISLPLRLVGITINAVFDLFKAVITLPARMIGGGSG